MRGLPEEAVETDVCYTFCFRDESSRRLLLSIARWSSDQNRSSSSSC